MTLALSVVALAVSALVCWYTRRAALRARQAALRARQALAVACHLTVREGPGFAEGGYMDGPPALTWLDPEECLLDQDLQCIRPSHHPHTQDDATDTI